MRRGAVTALALAAWSVAGPVAGQEGDGLPPDGGLPSGAAAAPEAEAPEAAAPETGWAMTCGAEACRLARQLADAGSGTTVAALTFVLPKGQAGARIRAVVPLGIDLRAGVWLAGARDVRAMPLVTCLQQGCLAVLDVDPVSLGLIASQQAVALRVTPYGGSEAMDLTFPLAGLAEAFSDARAALAE